LASLDIIEAAISSPIDWGVFEKMVVDVLTHDDLPRLRKYGSYKDGGIDAYDEAFYQDESQLERVVQITSQRTQTLKVSSTLDRLSEKGVTPKTIIFVFRHPVASTTRTYIQAQCKDAGISSDIRDQSYIVTQLARPGSTIFARYFDSIKQQIRALLDTPDPLQLTNDNILHSVLASIASYVINPHAQLVRNTLFIKTVLAAVVSLGKSSRERITEVVQKIIPEEKITIERIAVALTELERCGSCKSRDSLYEATDKELAQVGSILARVSKAYNDLRIYVIEACKKDHKCDQATIGYIERNLRQAMLQLIRTYGPLTSDTEPKTLDSETAFDVHRCLASNIPEPIGRSALLAFCAFVEDPTNAPLLAIFGRSYSALALRNLDPIGRRWQQIALTRSVLALDTDAVLGLLIEELPQHKALNAAVSALSRAGISIWISPDVLLEVVGHIERADTTYRKFGEQLSRMSPASVDLDVWHAVVQGYYYALKSGYQGDWTTYKKKYYDSSKPQEYMRFILSRKVKYVERDMHDIPAEWLVDMETLSAFITKKEDDRQKAPFREQELKQHRVEDDIRMAMHLSSYDISGPNAKGYLATEDRAFIKVEHHSAWRSRSRIVVLTHAVPQLADFICGQSVDDSDLVRLLFDPVVSAAADLIDMEMKTLSVVGVDLRNESIQRIEWTLRGRLHDAIQGYNNMTNADDRLRGAVTVLKEAKASGLTSDQTVIELADKYEDSLKEADLQSKQRGTMEQALKKIAMSMSTTKKAKRRISRILKELGLSLEDFKEEDDL
jgi:hypothetical protein